jgi:hypothetical protein
MKRAAGCLVLLALLAGGCGEEPTVEQQIIAAITEMESRGEEGRRSAFMEMVHESFIGQQGAMTRDEFRLFMIMQWNRNQRLQAQLFPIRVKDLGVGQASAKFKALITGGRGLIPERGQLYEIVTLWVKTGGDWLLVKADWKPIPLEEVI